MVLSFKIIKINKFYLITIQKLNKFNSRKRTYLKLHIQSQNMKQIKEKKYIPKGSYHTFCRKMYGIQDLQKQKSLSHNSNRNKQIRTVQTERLKKINQFNTFQQYMKNIANQEDKKFNIKAEIQKNDHQQIRNTSKTYRVALKQKKFDERYNIQSQRQARSKTQRFNKRPYNNQDKKQGKQQNAMQIVGAFLPFFKIKLDNREVQNRQKRDFRIDNKKFRLKSLLIEQNKFVSQKWFPLI